MSTEERDNWKKVKEALEEAGNTDCYYYKRAVAIVEGGNDPIEALK